MKLQFKHYLIVYILGFLLLAAFTAGDYGLSWDEPTRWRSGDLKLDYYRQLFTGKHTADVMRHAPSDVYPGLYDLPLAILRRTSSVDAVTLSRIWSSAFALLLVLAPVFMTRILLRRWRESGRSTFSRNLDELLPFVSGVILISMPELNGHLFMNPKDVPFAATYAWGIIALLAVVGELPRLGWGTVGRFGIFAGLAMATRPPGVALFAFFALFATLWVLVVERQATVAARVRNLLSLAGKGVVGLAIAWTILVPFWPKTQRSLLSPFLASTEGVERLTTFSSAQPVLFNGQFYDAATAPWTYSLKMFVIKQPEWILLLLLVAAIVCAASVPRWIKDGRNGDRFVWSMGLIAGAALFPWLFVIVSGAAIHNGFRHMFYVLPFVAVVAAFGFRYALGRVWAVQRWRLAAFALVAYMFAMTSLQIAQLYPYQYIYYNSLVGGVSGAYGRYETDYWFLAAKEGFEILEQASGSEPIRVFVMGPQDVAKYYLRPGMKLVTDPAEAECYIGRPVSDLVKRGKLLGGVQRLGLPLIVAIDLRPVDAGD